MTRTNDLAEPTAQTLTVFDGPRDIDNPGDAASAVLDLLDQWGKERLQAGPRPALMLSGGVDSQLLAAVYESQGLNPLTVTVAVPGSPDAVGAASAAGHLRLDHHLIDTREVVGRWREVANALETDELWEVTAGVPLVAVFSLLSDLGVTGPVISGGGADAVFLGGWSPSGALRGEQLRRAAATLSFPIPDFYERLIGAEGKQRYVQPYATQAMWGTAARLTESALYVDRGGVTYDKAALREAAVRLGIPRHLAWTTKDPLQKSSGLMGLLADEARAWLARRPLATHYSDPRTEPAEQALARLWLATGKAATDSQ